ncbi:S-adenosyl-L-methionine-dependent methyltransferase [Crepidotus variabilis]|uniref:S-adenosyl-L-methionine-dependent methyltransferase n=1 Tax=Crepidotus variabilis TaxID=179855 RepID=A0A9P6JTF7_9AGAR|nr:S-adenosyl-L-methionine-dependent methyltransferase [Crepidotus variabilis]
MFSSRSYSHSNFAMDSDSDVESDDFSIASGSMVTSSKSTATSHTMDQSMRSASPVSVVSIDSTMQLFKRAYGRELNNYSDVYNLPADEEELQRLDLQHGVFVKIFGDKYAPAMAEVLAETVPGGERKTCLDLGCGAGSWIMDVARDFPHVSAVAVDLIPMQATDMPQNLRSEVDDINLGLQHYNGDFDVVHARLIAAGVTDYHQMIDQIAHVVRPGGLVDLSEFDFYMYDANHQRILFESNDEIRPPWWGRWMHYFHDAVKAKGGDVDAATNLHHWVSQNSLFEDVTYKEYWLPIVPMVRVGPNAEQLQKIDANMKINHVSFLGSGRPLLLGNGIPESVVELVERNAEREIGEQQIPQYTRLQCVTARKRRSAS